MIPTLRALLPVVVNTKLVGIMSDRDIRDAYPSSSPLLRGKDLDDFAEAHTIEEGMPYHLITVSTQTSLREAAQRLRRQRPGGPACGGTGHADEYYHYK